MMLKVQVSRSGGDLFYAVYWLSMHMYTHVLNYYLHACINTHVPEQGDSGGQLL